MIKVFLYLTVILASELTYGEGISTFEDNQLIPECAFYEQNEPTGFEIEDKEEPATQDFQNLVESPKTHAHQDSLRYSPFSSVSCCLIRAPPASS